MAPWHWTLERTSQGAVHMIQRSAFRRLTATFILSIVTSLGCSTDASEPPPADLTAEHPPMTISPPTASAISALAEAADARGCRSTINADGLVCSRCPGDAPGAAPECLAAACDVRDHCLRCVDPKGRVGRDCSVDYGVFETAGASGSSNAEFNFSICTFQWGVPLSSGTTCHYPGVNTCKVTDAGGDWHCLECSYADGSGSSVCADKSNPLYDPLIARPDDLPAPGFCVNDLDADGKVQCTTCMKNDLSATRSCHYPGIVECQFVFPEEGDDGKCSELCTFEDGHQALMCDSPRGPQPRPLP
jgi:hypothetical protein